MREEFPARKWKGASSERGSVRLMCKSAHHRGSGNRASHRTLIALGTTITGVMWP